MTQSEYKTEVQSILDAHVDAVRSKLLSLPSVIPESARSIAFTIFVDQDGEGFLTVRAALDGPDLYVINKAIGDCAVLFDTKMVDGEMVPPMPLMDPFDQEFSVHDSLTDCAAAWLTHIWGSIDHNEYRIPVSITSHDDYGTKLPVILAR